MHEYIKMINLQISYVSSLTSAVSLRIYSKLEMALYENWTQFFILETPQSCTSFMTSWVAVKLSIINNQIPEMMLGSEYIKYPQYDTKMTALILMITLKMLFSHLSAQKNGLNESIMPASPNKFGKIQTLNPKITHKIQIRSLTAIKPTKKTRRYRETSQRAYLTAQGQTGKSTRASIPIIPRITVVFLEAVESNLKEQNLGRGDSEY